MALSYSEVAEIVKIVDSSNCDEVSLELEGARILIRRRGAGASDPAAAASAQAPAAGSPLPQDGGTQADSASTSPAAPASDVKSAKPDVGTITAPMIGTFYTRPSPEEPEFVTVGSKVEFGTPLCVIEVMKLFTTVESTKAGTVRAVLAENAEMVEYGQPLFVIE